MPGSGVSVIGARTTLFVGACLLASALCAQGGEGPLDRLRVDGKKAEWDGIELGMSVVQIERRIGTTVAPTATGAAGCGAYTVEVERGTLRLTLGLPSNRPGAKVETIYVHFEGYQVLAKRDALVAELKRVAPGAAYLPPRTQPELAEAEAPEPAYAFVGEGAGFAARLEPGRGLLLGRRDCVE